MTREIKFRAWDKKQKKMFYGVSTGTVKIWDESAPLLSHEFGYSEDCIFEQYTGIKDKNGREIYEGDIVRVEAYSRVYQVVYRQWDCSFMFENDEDEEIANMFNGFPDKYEIIGNIHENPELLGGEECV